jgi:hypothetical protein
MPICRFCCQGGSRIGRGRAVRVAERNQVPVRYGPEVARLADRFPRALGQRGDRSCSVSARGRAVRIAVIALADHAGSRVIRMGSATEHDFSASDEPGHPVGPYVKR